MAKSTAAAAPQTSDMAVRGLRSRRGPQGPAKDKDGICDSSCSIWPNLQRGVLLYKSKCRSHRLPGGRRYTPYTREGIVRPLSLRRIVKKSAAAMRCVENSKRMGSFIQKSAAVLSNRPVKASTYVRIWHSGSRSSRPR